MKVFALFCVMIVLSSAVTNIRKGYSEKNSALSKLHEVTANSQYASNLISQVELHLTSGGKVDEVIGFVKDALKKAQTEKMTMTNKYRSEISELGVKIEEYKSTITTKNAELNKCLKEIETLETDINNLKATISRLEKEIEGLNEREQLLIEARDNDEKAFDMRQKRTEGSIVALNKIIPALEGLQEKGSVFLQKTQEEIGFALQQIPDSNPIKQFVELSTQFDPKKLKMAIDKLSLILEAMEKGRTEDEIAEKASMDKYNALMAEIDTLRSAKTKELAAAKSDLKGKQNSLDTAKSNRLSLETCIKTTQGLLKTTEELKKTTEEVFARKSKDAQDTIDALKAALDILTDNEGTLQEQEVQAKEDIA